MSPGGALVEVAGVVKQYGGLRPLRIERLLLREGELVAIGGLDAATAEVLVNLITGVTLPDRGAISVFGRDTARITESAEWLATVDRFGIVSARAVLLEGLTVAQNLAMPFSLDIEPLEPPLRERAVVLARELDLPESVWDRRVGDVDPTSRLRVRVARALALDPAVVLLEHPTAELSRADAGSIGRGIRGVLERRHAAGLALTADRAFARAFAARPLLLNAATGGLQDEGRGWFRRGSTEP